MSAGPDRARIWTIGHSSRSLDEFLALLAAHRIECIADVRRHAGSRKHPQFNPDALARSLGERGIDYVAMPDLGGRRSTRGDSPHTVWRNPSFRGYADYMDSPAFAEALDRLAALAGASRTAMMCSEAVWWRCHRSMISDALKACGWCVLHVLDAGPAKEHPYTSAASIVDGRLAYGAGPAPGDAGAPQSVSRR
ncbi:MAG TPA: DUF488 domain-containing protein [Zeimonas sp.]